MLNACQQILFYVKSCPISQLFPLQNTFSSMFLRYKAHGRSYNMYMGEEGVSSCCSVTTVLFIGTEFCGICVSKRFLQAILEVVIRTGSRHLCCCSEESYSTSSDDYINFCL